MLSSSDLPACPACGSREVHAVTKILDRAELEKLADYIAGPLDQVQIFYACRRCGRDQTDAWQAVQPADRPEPKPIVYTRTRTFADAIQLGILAHYARPLS